MGWKLCIYSPCSAPQAAYVSIIIRCCQWFGQLFVLLVLSFIHFYAVFFPTHFRAITTRNISAVNVSILVTGLLLTIPLLTPYCGYAYYVNGHYWTFDMSKPYTYIYCIFNIVLQIASVAVVALVDLIIIWKIHRLRSSLTASNRNAFSSTVPLRPRIEGRVSRETRFALSFLFLSACFLGQTLFFNLPLGMNFVVTFFKKVTSKINLAKWAFYAFGSAAIRSGLFRLFKFRRVRETTAVTSVATVIS
ncbi:hypothetical protein GCK32_002045 [Trichostrongylus colubriformis]|uniref:7TM GPCR serpentine receptor class x (Srx) domain-containing protein n=1 Tax=Trichostrongylus colubriformis TaxID=6319 RepID=A0AAN8FYT4_TRICO